MDFSLYFKKAPLIPAIVVDNETNRVLMLAYMNEESMKKSFETGYTWFIRVQEKSFGIKAQPVGMCRRLCPLMPIVTTIPFW